MSKQNEELRRGFGLSTTTSVVIASMVGVGILTTSGYVIKDTHSHTLLLALWFVGGLLALCGALTVAELATAMPYAGGEYVFIREAYGRLCAFLYGWVSFLIGFSAPAAIAAYAAARASSTIHPGNQRNLQKPFCRWIQKAARRIRQFTPGAACSSRQVPAARCGSHPVETPLSTS